MSIGIRNDKAVQYYRLIRLMANIFSKDKSSKVGALFIRPDTYEILTLGYNGMPRGVDETLEARWERPTKYDYVEHGERNAIFNAARTGTSLLNSICIVTLFPCCDCARGIIQSGAKMVVTLDPFKTSSPDLIERWGKKWEISTEMFNESGVTINYLDVSDVQLSPDDTEILLNGLIQQVDRKKGNDSDADSSHVDHITEVDHTTVDHTEVEDNVYSYFV